MSPSELPRPEGGALPAEALEGSPGFLIDRSLGRKHLAGRLRALGLEVHTLASVWGEEQAQGLADETWLERAGSEGWAVLMKDDRIRRRPSERDALLRAGVRAFCLTNANLRAVEQTARFEQHLPKIIALAGAPGPFIYGVYKDDLRLLYGRGATPG